jgi:homoserine kinase
MEHAARALGVDGVCARSHNASPMPRAPLTVRVACSTSNLGPGFDTLGLCLSIFLEVDLLGRAPGDAHVWEERAGEARDWPVENERVTRAFALGARIAGARETPPMTWRARSEIPVCRGLGSSGAATAAGLLLGVAWAGGAPRTHERALVAAGAELEGHPDNSTASLLGGCTLATPDGAEWRVARQPVHPSLGFAVAWPRATVATADARGVLPGEVSFNDAVENPRRLAALLEGLRGGDPDWLRVGAEDRLHVRYRLPLIAGAARALDAAREAGAALATISGSGSALVAIGPPARMRAVADALAGALEDAAGRVVDVVREAPVVRELR